jgi:hypothetical protein
MKIAIFFLGVFFLTMCESNHHDCDKTGEIIGLDMTLCGCCGGWVIEVDGHTYLANSIPNAEETFGPEEDWVYPIPIYLSYKNGEYCSSMRIENTCIKKR